MVYAVSIILVMFSITNPYGFLLFAVFFTFGFSLMFAVNIPHFKREMKRGRTFKQICKEDIFVVGGGSNVTQNYNHNSFRYNHNASRAFCSTDLSDHLARRYSYHFSFLTENIHHK